MSGKFFGGIKSGSTDVRIPVVLRDSSTGALKPSVTFSQVTAYYQRQGVNPTQVTLSAGTSNTASHSDGKFFEIDSTNFPGQYYIDYPDDAWSASSDWVLICVTGSGIEAFIAQYSLSPLALDTSGRVLLQAATHTGAIIPTVSALTGHTVQTGDAYAIVNHVDYGNAKLVRSLTPANALSVDSSNAAKVSGANITLSSSERNAIADATLARSLGTESYATDGTVPTTSQMLFQIWSAISEFSISGGTTKTSKKLDGSTTAMTFTLTLDANSRPIAITRTS